MQVTVQRQLTSAEEEQWQAFLKTARTSHPEQDLRFADVLRAGGQEVAFAMGREGGKVVATGLFALRPHPFLKGAYSDAMAYSGPVCDDFDALTRFMTALTRAPELRRVGRLRVTPYWLEADGERVMHWFAAQGWRGFEHEPMRHTGLIDLRGSDQDILARFNQTGRRKVRKAEKLDLTVHTEVTETEAQDFLARLNAHHAHRRIATMAPPVFQALMRNVLGSGDLGTLHVVRHQGRFVAGTILYRSPDTAHFMHSVHDDAELARLDDLRISPFLLFQTMKWARDKGCSTYDIEGYLANPAPGNPSAHIYRYKSEFNPREVGRVAGHGRVIAPLLHLTGNARELARTGLRRMRARLLKTPSPQTGGGA